MLAPARLTITRTSLAGDSSGADDLASPAKAIRRMFTALYGPPRNEQHARH